MHTIQLRGPWQAKVLSAGDPCPAANLQNSEPDRSWRRVPLGDWSSWLGREFRGVVCFQRRFGRPTGLLPTTQVELVIDAVDWQADIFLNDQPLGVCRWGEAPWRRDIGQLLLPSNQLRLTVSLPEWTAAEDQQRRGDRHGQAGGILGRVVLEIEDQA